MSDTVVATSPKLMVLAGEASGDAHGAELISALRRAQPGARIIGCGGPQMRAAGQEQLFDLSRHAVFGLAEVVWKYLEFRGMFQRLIDYAVAEKPDVIIYIDNSGFNLRLAEALRPQLPGTKFVYYISPQVWASRSKRVNGMARDFNLVLSIFPFEKEWYAKRAPGLRVEWVGHPLLDRLNVEALGQTQEGRIAVMPGSRAAEVERHLPVFWEAAQLMAARRSGLQFVFILPNGERHRQVAEWIAQQPPPSFSYEIYHHYPLSHLNRCELALVKSGTASLDCAFAGVPPVVVYRLNPVTYEVARRMVKVKHVSMVNLLAARPPIVPELIQDQCTPQNIAQTALELLKDERKRKQIKAGMAEVIGTLGGPGASERAAAAILELLGTVEISRQDAKTQNGLEAKAPAAD